MPKELASYARNKDTLLGTARIEAMSREIIANRDGEIKAANAKLDELKMQEKMRETRKSKLTMNLLYNRPLRR